MIKFLKKIQNTGIHSNTDLETVKSIRIVNTMALIGMISMLPTIIYASFGRLPVETILIILFFLVCNSVAIILNYFQKTLAATICFTSAMYMAILTFSILFDSEFGIQYFLLLGMGLPLVLFRNRSIKLSLSVSALGILFWIYLEWHFANFKPVIVVDPSYVYSASLTNNLILCICAFVLYFLIITENDKQLQEIKNKTIDLEEKNVELEHFAYIASHDLNEPLRTVNSFVDIIKEEYQHSADDNLNIYFTFINDALSKMRLLIDGLLSYSRLGKSSDYQMVNIHHLIIEIKTELNQLIKLQNVTIQVHNLPIINCFEQEIKQLFHHLITNAIKFQQPGAAPVIEITYDETPNYWQFCVADNGIGISPKKHSAIFNMFTRLHLSEKYEGHGIGLAFCKKIVEAHKGKICVESSPGNGSRFYFTIQKYFKYEKETQQHFVNR